ncbi:MAG: NADPH:quinone oxidoreductase family protein [Burkholderiales bacterium]
MKALLCKAWGGPETLVLEELPSPQPGPGEVVVDVKAAGVNFPDVLIIQNKYQLKPPLPFAPGAELAGVIKEIGAGVTGFKAGDRVIAMPMWGAFAEECVVRATQLIRMPAGLDFPTAAAFTLTYGTSWHALKDRGQLRAGETLLVLGAAGGVGLAAIEIGKALGARVIAAASSAEKLAVCRAHGADETIDYAVEDLRARLKTLTGDKGADVVYDPVGGQYAEPAVRSTAWRGRYLVVGFANGEIPRIPLNLLLLKGSALVGVYWGDWTRREPAAAAAGMAELLGWLAAGKLKPHLSARYPLARAAEALVALASRKVAGKLVVEPEA